MRCVRCEKERASHHTGSLAPRARRGMVAPRGFRRRQAAVPSRRARIAPPGLSCSQMHVDVHRSVGANHAAGRGAFDQTEVGQDACATSAGTRKGLDARLLSGRSPWILMPARSAMVSKTWPWKSARRHASPSGRFLLDISSGKATIESWTRRDKKRHQFGAVLCQRG